MTNAMRRLGAGVLFCALAACGASSSHGNDTTGGTPAVTAVARPVALATRLATDADPTNAGRAITAFGNELFSAVRSQSQPATNLAVSPASVAMILAMLEPGAVGDAQSQLRELLHVDDPASFHASMNAVEQSLESRVPETFGEGDDPGEVTVHLANAAYLQQGYPFEPEYLATVGANYGPVLNEVDFSLEPDLVAHEINRFVAANTNDRITDLVADGVIPPETVLALVNALYLKASWLQPFDPAFTADATFTTSSGAAVTVPMMRGGSQASARGDGWVGATKAYTGGLIVQFILPDEGQFDAVANNLADVFNEFDTAQTSGATLGVPRFETRFDVRLPDALKSLGLVAPFAPGGLTGIAADPRLIIDNVVHQTFVSMDEEGTEADAATVALVYPVSAPVQPPVPVVLNRPFLYRVIDNTTSATLLVGQIVDPTSG